jgi:hypothetical protein
VSRYHRLSNTIIRLAPDGSEAWISSSFYAVVPDRLRTSDGYLMARVVRRDPTWKIADIVVSLERSRYFVEA